MHAKYSRATSEALAARNNPRLREIELFCDAVAILTLRKAGIDASHFIASVKKIERFNEGRFGTPLNSAAYPSVSARKHSSERVLKWIEDGLEFGGASAKNQSAREPR